MTKLTIRLPDKLNDLLEIRAKNETRSVSNMICRILSLEIGGPCTEELDETLNPELPLT